MSENKHKRLHYQALAALTELRAAFLGPSCFPPDETAGDLERNETRSERMRSGDEWQASISVQEAEVASFSPLSKEVKKIKIKLKH
jgi:hypothetical protein